MDAEVPAAMVECVNCLPGIFPWISYVNCIHTSGEFLCSRMISFYLPGCCPACPTEQKGRQRELDWRGWPSYWADLWVMLCRSDILIRFPGLQETYKKQNNVYPCGPSTLPLYAWKRLWPNLPNENKCHLGGVSREDFRQLTLLF